MRILYIDIDSLRPDHLGCCGYHRATSPNIDRIAASGVRFDNVHVSDAPCLPSRSALWSGRHGIHTGVIGHGGTSADPLVEGPRRAFRSRLGQTNWMTLLRQAGLRTATVSPFGERHSAWHWYAGFNEVMNTGKNGQETADEVSPTAVDWLGRNGDSENWFLHVNLWDPHTPYRTPAEFGRPFTDAPLPAWLTEEVLQAHREGCGPHSAREVTGYGLSADERKYWHGRWPDQPTEMHSMADVRRMFDGYDTGVRYADEHVGRILNALADRNVLDETVVMISSDHGETLGELNIYGDHQLADQITTRVPLIVRWPGVSDSQAGRVDSALHYQFDWAATLTELAGGRIPEVWDGASFAEAFRGARSEGRDYLVVSNGAWSCQRAVRWDNYICIRSYHDGLHGFPDIMLFDLAADPHEQHDIAADRPDLVDAAMRRLEDWQARMMRTATNGRDPMWTVMEEGGPYHTRGELPRYVERLRATGRGAWADLLIAQHSHEAGAARGA